jgi:hypothetical protein
MSASLTTGIRAPGRVSNAYYDCSAGPRKVAPRATSQPTVHQTACSIIQNDELDETGSKRRLSSPRGHWHVPHGYMHRIRLAPLQRLRAGRGATAERRGERAERAIGG